MPDQSEFIKPPRLWSRQQDGRAPAWVIKDRGKQIYTGAGDDEVLAKKRLLQYVASPSRYLEWVADRKVIRAMEPPNENPSAIRMRRMRERKRAEHVDR